MPAETSSDDERRYERSFSIVHDDHNPTMRRSSHPVLKTSMFIIAPLVMGIIAFERKLPQSPHRASAVRVHYALDAVGTAFALTAVALLFVDAVFRAAGSAP